jgi:RNA polymerase sigma-70 factor (ECF subfamily)
VAIGFRDGPETGLAEIARLDQKVLAGYYLLDAVRAYFLARLDRTQEGYLAYREAARQAPTEAGRRFLERRAASLPVE